MQMTKNLHKVTAVTIIIYMARKVHTAYMFLECFEACQVSELTYWLLTKWKVLGSVWKVNLMLLRAQFQWREAHDLGPVYMEVGGPR